MKLTKNSVEEKYSCKLTENKLEDGIRTIWVAEIDEKYVADGWSLKGIADKLEKVLKRS